MSELLTVEGLTKRFNDRRVLEDINFSVRPGEVLGLIGPNGSGKTTLFECLAGLMPADAGAVKSNNKDLDTTTNAIPAFANIDPPRMFQLQAQFIF
ncbi:MAG: ATP-binding cassette domain-containing protein [Pyrinomonadaceae bacterium]